MKRQVSIILVKGLAGYQSKLQILYVYICTLYTCYVYILYAYVMRLPRWHGGKESTCQCRRLEFDPWVRKIPWNRKWQPTPVFLPGKLHGQRSLAGYSPWGCRESDTTDQLSMHTTPVYIICIYLTYQ